MFVILIDPNHQVYKFFRTIYFDEERCSWGPEWSKSSKFGQHLLLAVRKPAKVRKHTTHKDAQNRFGQLVEKGQNCGNFF
jgi:hypothetical protein